MHWVEKPGTSLEAMTRITLRASRELRAIPGVRNFGAHIGRAEVADEVVGANFTELWISLDPAVDYEATVARIQEVVDGYPGLQRDLLTYLRERIKEVLTGASATIVVRIFGPDLDVLQRKAAEVGKAIAAVEGAADVKVQALTLVPQVEVTFRPERAQQLGVTPGRRARHGRDDAARHEGRRGLRRAEDLRRRRLGRAGVRRDLFALRRLPIELPGGGYAPLASGGRRPLAPTPNEITREGGSRRIDVTCNVRGRDLGSVARDIEAALGRRVVRPRLSPRVAGRIRRARASRSAGCLRSARCRCSASCWCCTSTSARRGWWRSWR